MIGTEQVSISYYPMHVSGQTLSNIGGITQSVPTYNDPYFVAYMPIAEISATGSSYTEALDNLLTIATASTTIDPGVLPYKSNW